MLTSWPEGTLVALVVMFFVGLMAYLLGGLVWMFFCGVCNFADFAWTKTIPVRGVVIEKKWYDAYTIFTPIGNGGMITTPVPASFNLLVRVGEKSGWIGINQGFFGRVTEGSEVEVSVRYGRFTGRIDVKDI
jgi:hypothetical protein